MPGRPKVFRPGGSKTRTALRREYDERRGSARDRGYSARWDREAAVFRQAHPLCLGCEAVDRVTVAALVDHIIPHRGDQQLFWDQSNWQSACEPHGNAIKQQLELLYMRGKIAATELRLDSATAIALTKRSLP